MIESFSTIGLDDQQGIVPGIRLEGNRHALLSEVKFCKDEASSPVAGVLPYLLPHLTACCLCVMAMTFRRYTPSIPLPSK